jgi:hypothetical protein
MAGKINSLTASALNEGQDPPKAEHNVHSISPAHPEPTTSTQDPLELQDYDLSVSSTVKDSAIG